jgi:hypothetical protein
MQDELPQPASDGVIAIVQRQLSVSGAGEGATDLRI